MGEMGSFGQGGGVRNGFVFRIADGAEDGAAGGFVWQAQGRAEWVRFFESAEALEDGAAGGFVWRAQAGRNGFVFSNPLKRWRMARQVGSFGERRVGRNGFVFSNLLKGPRWCGRWVHLLRGAGGLSLFCKIVDELERRRRPWVRLARAGYGAAARRSTRTSPVSKWMCPS